MTDDGWMNRILDDERDRALRDGRAKHHAQQLEIAAARARIDELSGRCETLEARFSLVLRRLFGDPGILALLELLEPLEVNAWLASPLERRLLDALERPGAQHSPSRG
jgi:hypothetical protein